jgi:hypothetical protein
VSYEHESRPVTTRTASEIDAPTSTELDDIRRAGEAALRRHLVRRRAETVTLTRLEYERLADAARLWWLLVSSSHVDELLSEWWEWHDRRALRQTSYAVAGGLDWRAVASAPTYAELERRRRLTTETPCGACGRTVTLVHPLPDELAARLPDLSSVRCPRCVAVRGVAA